MHLVAAGAGKLSNGTSYSELCSQYKIRKLLSHYSELKHIEDYICEHSLMVDSGGHVYNKASGLNVVGFGSHKAPRPAREEAKRYLRFLEKYKDKKWVMVEPDYYGQLPTDYIDGFYKDVMAMNPSFEYIRVYHPGIKEDGGKMNVLRKWIDEGQNYIGISKSAENLYSEIFNITKDKVRLHGFALTGKTILEKYPFYSADSTTALVIPIKYKSIPIGDGKMLSKPKAIKDKDIRYLMYLDDDKRIIKSIQEFKKQEIHYTKLWEKRGVIFNQ